jgi:hypothetical protein
MDIARKIAVKLTSAAKSELGRRAAPLDVQLELLFSCVLRKRLLFRLPEGVTRYPLVSENPKLNVVFRPVMTKVCLVSDVDDVPDLEDFPIHNAAAFTPRWLSLDFRSGEWKGEYGWI